MPCAEPQKPASIVPLNTPLESDLLRSFMSAQYIFSFLLFFFQVISFSTNLAVLVVVISHPDKGNYIMTSTELRQPPVRPSGGENSGAKRLRVWHRFELVERMEHTVVLNSKKTSS